MPVCAFASVEITEIMYDLPGGDTGREWVEVTNTGGQAVDISKYKIAEGTTNHTLKLVSGNTLLAPGASAILADDAEKFKTDWPSFAGVIFNTVLSLSNTGESIAIKNASSSIENSVSYSANMGAAGDGGSLQKSGSTFVAAMPSPGIFPGPLSAVPVVVKPAASPVSAKTPKVSKAKTSNVLSANQAAAAIAAPRNTFDISHQKTEPATIPIVLWVVGLGAIVGLGVTGVLYARLNRPRRVFVEETNQPKEEFEIIET